MLCVSVVGARPQFIKLKPIELAFKNRTRLSHKIIHTGQHYDYLMSKIFFSAGSDPGSGGKEFSLPEPDWNLDVGSGSHGAMTGRALERIEAVLLESKPSLVIVYGDTNSTLAGALAASKLHIPVAHVEAGLRSFRKEMPEEVNRVVTDHLSTLLFCPTKTAVQNLKKEGIHGKKTKPSADNPSTYLTGDVMLDALKYVSKHITADRVRAFSLEPGKFNLLTVHRQENTDVLENLKGILAGIGATKAKTFFPCHPRTKKVLSQNGIAVPPNVIVHEPVGYMDLLALESHAQAIFTDSGGVQKEGAWFGTPVITLRNETEWTETVAQGRNILAGTDPKKILSAYHISVKRGRKKPQIGTSHASSKIVKIIEDFLLK